MKKFLIIAEETGTGYSAYSPDVPGCVSTGRTRREVEQNMREAIEFHLEGLRFEGLSANRTPTQLAWKSGQRGALPRPTPSTSRQRLVSFSGKARRNRGAQSRSSPEETKMNRPEKLSDRDTIVYEIDMLEHCYNKLVQVQSRSTLDRYTFLECFLLHCRNLLDFFGKEPHGDDLSIGGAESWAADPAAAKGKIPQLQAKGKSLWHEYEDRKTRLDTISRYLHHCTKQRTEAKDWRVQEMYSKLSKLVQEFHQIIGCRYHVAVENSRLVDASTGMSTMTVKTFDPPVRAG